MKIKLFGAIALMSLFLKAQNATFQKGIILDSIAIEGTANESFALYLPKSFEAEKPSSIVFIFDPAARGKAGIIPFIESAEKYQLILACSNNSRNTAYAENFAMADRWFKDVFSKFNIDPDRIYGAGFSGGARLITAIGVLSGAFRGIVGCGAAFSSNSGQMPYTSDHFLYAGLVGTRDMNYQEMYRADDWLKRIGLPHMILSFEDDHRWPDSEYILQAFDWFHLREYLESGHKPESDFSESYLSDQLLRIENLIKSEHWILAAEAYDRIVEFDAVLTIADSVLANSDQLKKSKEYKKALKLKQQISTDEKNWTDRLIGKIRKETSLENPAFDGSWWSKELAKLDELVQDEEEAKKDMGQRLRSMIFAVGIESFQLSLAQNNEKEIYYYSKFLNNNWPDNAWVQFRIAVGFAGLGINKKAIDHLEYAIDNGWNNKEMISSDPAFDNLKTNPEFNRLLEKL